MLGDNLAKIARGRPTILSRAYGSMDDINSGKLLSEERRIYSIGEEKFRERN